MKTFYLTRTKSVKKLTIFICFFYQLALYIDLSVQFAYLPLNVDLSNPEIPRYPTNLPKLIQEAAQVCSGEKFTDPQLRDSSNLRYGDMQCNLPLQLAGKMGLNAQKVAQRLINHMIQIDPEISHFVNITFSTNGFINFKFKSHYIFESLKNYCRTNSRTGTFIPQVQSPKTVVLDYAGPNLVKNLHVGHIRSVFLGDTISRLTEKIGHHTFRISHVGDWGLPFGKVLAYINETFPSLMFSTSNHSIHQYLTSDSIENIYKIAERKYIQDPFFKKSSHKFVKLLQSNNPHVFRIWTLICNLTSQSIREILKYLEIQPPVEEGESSYANLLPSILSNLREKKLLKQINGKTCAFIPGDNGESISPDFHETLVALQRADGTYLYSATDIAAIVHRYRHYGCDKIIYILDETQSHYLQQIFKIIRRSGLVPNELELIHLSFGVVTNTQGQKLSSRNDQSPSLSQLIESAYSETEAWINHKGIKVDQRHKKNFINALAIGAVKFSELSMNPVTAYRYTPQKLISSKRSSISYIYYSLLRTYGILNKAFEKSYCNMDYPEESSPLTILAKHISKFPLVLHSISQSLKIHQLTNYIFELCRLFNHSYEEVPIILMSGNNTNSSLSNLINPYGLLTCQLTKLILLETLNILNILPPPYIH